MLSADNCYPLFNQNFLPRIPIPGGSWIPWKERNGNEKQRTRAKIWRARVALSIRPLDAKTNGTFEHRWTYLWSTANVRAAILVASRVRYVFFFLPLLLFLLPHYSYFFFPSFLFLLFYFAPLFTCNTSVRNRVALNESVGVYRSWQYFKSALLRQMQRVGQVRPGIHLNSLLRHI